MSWPDNPRSAARRAAQDLVFSKLFKTGTDRSCCQSESLKIFLEEKETNFYAHLSPVTIKSRDLTSPKHETRFRWIRPLITAVVERMTSPSSLYPPPSFCRQCRKESSSLNIRDIFLGLNKKIRDNEQLCGRLGNGHPSWKRREDRSVK